MRFGLAPPPHLGFYVPGVLMALTPALSAAQNSVYSSLYVAPPRCVSFTWHSFISKPGFFLLNTFPCLPIFFGFHLLKPPATT
jgi:hypothetical protein